MDRLATRLNGAQDYKSAKLTIYEKEDICKSLQPHYKFGTLAKIWDVHGDTISQAVDFLLKKDPSFKVRRLKGTTVVLIPSSQIPKLLEYVDNLSQRRYLPSKQFPEGR